MASRKHLKKAIKDICSGLFADCVALTMVGQGDNEGLQKLMADILATYGDYVKRISHVEPGVSAREFFRKLRSDFAEKANSLSDEIIRL